MYAAVMGYGTIGSGVVRVIEEHHDTILAKNGLDIRMKYILDLKDCSSDPYGHLVVNDVNIILNDPEVDVVVETMGGTNPAFQFVKGALEAGKSVCTSNKALVAAHGPELLKIAEENNVNFMFEASVGGGIPIIRPLNEALTADAVIRIQGILNGTTNYILTRMENEGLSFEPVLADAQALGYAEKDPTADVDGWDACRKIAILSSLSYGKTVKYEDIYTEGIRNITSEDFIYAKAMKRGIKLIGSSNVEGDAVYACVAPMLVEDTHPLYAVKDVFNAICVTGDVVDDVMFYGKGAGSFPTASAVVADVIECCKSKGKNINIYWKGDDMTLAPFEEQERQFFVRVKEENAEAAAAVFGEVEFIDAGVAGERGFVTGLISEKEFAHKYESIEGAITRIRIRK